MPGGFWSNNGGWPTRRRRSLLGRQNRSDNDLSHHDAQLCQQQLLQPHTTLVIPDNVKTILIAGTPECWSLSTSPTSGAKIYSPTNNCDASVLTTVSELSPDTMAIDEDTISDGLDWMRPQNTNRTSKRETSRQPPQLRHNQQSQRKEPSSMVVMYRLPLQPSVPPQQALEIWRKSWASAVFARQIP
jgi:hypothetical protein